MPKFSDKSKLNLLTCDPRLQELAYIAIHFVDFAVLEGHRNQQKQEEAFKAGTSKLHWPYSMHNQLPSQAFDAVPYPVDWKDRERMIHFAGIMIGIGCLLGFRLKWGGDWNGNLKMDETFEDFGHYELP